VDGGVERPPPTPVQRVLSVRSDTDDAVWISLLDERLHYSATSFNIEVGVDFEQARSGLRFALPVPAGSTIDTAFLRLERRSGPVTMQDAIQVQVFDSLDVPPFDEGHEHPPDEHDAGGLRAGAVRGFMVGSGSGTCVSPDLRELVQHVVDKQGWSAGGFIGFVLAPYTGSFGNPEGWVAFFDFSSGSGQASLDVTYVPPS
jgi:hypothetical protein